MNAETKAGADKPAAEKAAGRVDAIAMRPVILLIEHGLGGGVARHVDDLSVLFRERADFVRLKPNRGGLLEVRGSMPGLASALYFRAPQELDALSELLRNLGVGRIHFHHTLRLPRELLDLPKALDLPYDYTIHDYFCFCPQITLTTESFEYCGEPDEAGCGKCLRIRPSATGESIQGWRARYRPFVEGAARVFVPSVGVELKMRRYFPAASVILAPHPEPQDVTIPQIPAWTHRDGNLKVVVLGVLNAIKGADLLEECAIDAARRVLPLEFHLVGYAYRSLSRAGSRLTVYGKYRDADLSRLLHDLDPHIAWFPAKWPETYSYTLSAALRNSLPVASTNIGAIHDRLAGRAFSWTLPWDSNAQAWNDFFARLRSQPSSCGECLVPAGSQSVAPFSYRKDYVQASSGISGPQIGRRFEIYRNPLRASPFVIVQYIKGYARELMSAAYRLPGVRRIAVAALPEHRLQLLRRWLDRF